MKEIELSVSGERDLSGNRKDPPAQEKSTGRSRMVSHGYLHKQKTESIQASRLSELAVRRSTLSCWPSVCHWRLIRPHSSLDRLCA
jgi:hypothetical protein